MINLNTVAKFDLEEALSLAIHCHGESRLADAESGYRRVLAARSDHADALNGLAIVLWQQGRLDEALECIARAVDSAPHIWRYQQTHGMVASSMRRFDQAVAAFERVCTLRPEATEGWTGLAQVLHELGRIEEAISAYRRARSLAPMTAAMANNFGVALEARGLIEEAIEVYQDGLAQRANLIPLYSNLGKALAALHRFDEALAVFRRGLELEQGQSELWFNYANALAARGAGTEAIAAYTQVLRIEPNNPRALINLGNVLRARSDLAGAIASYRRAIAASPDDHDAHNNLGVALLSSGRLDEAVLAFDRAIALKPDSSAAHNNLGNALKESGSMDAAIEAFRLAISLSPQDSQPHSNLIYSLYFHPDYDEAAILREAKQWAAVHARHVPRRERRSGDPERRLRIGYVSADFREHCQSLFTLPLLTNHDHERFKIHCYAQLPAADAVSARIATHADAWRPIYGLSDAEVEAVIRADEIDILVDLTMHMSNGRPLLFARKPAPVQMAWLAYPGTTGQPAIDFRITDPWLDPAEFDDGRYVERSLRLPHTFWCYDPGTAPQVNALPAAQSGQVTFGCLNNFCKVSDISLLLWAQVLCAVPRSRLVLLAAEGSHRNRVEKTLRSQGIAPDRLEFVRFLPRTQYLETYHRIDLCLDTLPYNGHTTSLDAYWMGVPVVTRVGDTVVGRAGWSQLNNLRLTELAAFDDAGFVRKAVSLATDLAALSNLRQGLRARMRESPLMDGQSFAAAMERIYRQVWREFVLRSADVE